MPEFTPAETATILLSLKVAATAALASLPAGIAVGWLLARRRFLGKSLLDALVHLPLVLPPVVVGYVLLVWMGQNGAVGRFLHEHFGIGFSWGGYESLAIPTSPEKLRKLAGFRPAGLSLRLSIGLEDPDDLIADLAAALERLGRQGR